jgi:hypothetical protein
MDPAGTDAAANSCHKSLFAACREQLAELADDGTSKLRYRQFARAGRRFARDAEFPGRLNALLKAPSANLLNRDL